MSRNARRYLQQADEPPVLDLGPMNTHYELVGNHTIHFRIKIYPSQDFKDHYLTAKPMYFALAVAAIFVFTTAIFITYDRCIERRQNLTMKSVARSTKVLNSLYPATVRGRLFESADDSLLRTRRNGAKQTTVIRVSNDRPSSNTGSLFRRVRPLQARSSIRTFLNECETSEGHDDVDLPRTAPIADLFPNSTVLFADISGFTAWSSEREPAQVFQLLVSGTPLLRLPCSLLSPLNVCPLLL